MPINAWPLDPRRDEDDPKPARIWFSTAGGPESWDDLGPDFELVDVSEGGLDFQAPTLEDAPAEDDEELEQFVKRLYGEDA